MAKKCSLFGVAALYIFLVWAALSTPWPSPVVFYSNQNRDDLRLVFKRFFAKALYSIDITMYAITDRELLDQLHKQAKRGVAVQIRQDRSTPLLSPLATPVKTKGLMHRKIVVIDDRLIVLGSANMTTSSLLHHDNLTIALDHPPLAQFLKHPTSRVFDFSVRNQNGKLWLLPDPEAATYLQRQIAGATHSIFIAMFTLTHPALLQALLDAHQRGIPVTVALDHYSARGASHRAVQFLASHGISLIFSQGLQLLHHKWAYIDKKQIVLGSTNWTKAAFTKNEDCLLFLDNLTPEQQTLFDRLCHIIETESTPHLYHSRSSAMRNVG